MPNTDNRIHIALSPWDLTDDYNRHAGAALLSILDHSSQPVVAHLLYDEKLCIGKEKETEYNKACYQKIADKYGCELQFHHVELPEWNSNIVNISTYSPGSLLRIELPELLPEIDKIIYIDCDTITLTDIAKLWNINVDGKSLAAVLDQGIPTLRNSDEEYLSKKRISLHNYFNTGVLLLNLSELRKISLTEKVWEYLKNNLDTPFPDQDAMNYICQNNFIKLDSKYNNAPILNDVNDDCIMHFYCEPKPWKEYANPYNDIYWEYIRKTPWCTDIHTFYSYLRSAPDVSECLPFLETDFLAHIDGTRKEKVLYAVHFIFCIIKSFTKGLRKKGSKK